MRLKDKVAIVVGAGQSPGEGVGNGRATALTFAREGAKVLCVDYNLGSAEETVDMVKSNEASRRQNESDIKGFVADAQRRWGRIDILHNNVGVSISGGDAELLEITEANFDRCVEQIRDRLKAIPIAVQMPVGVEDAFSGVVDLVEDDQGRVLQESACNGDALALAAREFDAAIADDHREAARKPVDEFASCRFGGL